MTNGNTNKLIKNVHIVLENEVINGSLLIQGNRIQQIMKVNDLVESTLSDDCEMIDGQGGWLLPGFIDVHVHGGSGADFMNANKTSFDAITRFHASQGTTGMLATTMTASKDAIEAVLQAVSDYREAGMPYAALYGVHLEGPFISEKWPGAQNPAYIKDPQLPWLKAWNEEWPQLIRQLTLAPEKQGALEAIAWLAEQGIVAAAGHTDALYDEVTAAANAGLSHAVHTYNAMRGLHHREPGTLGAVLTDDRISAEIIADGEHVHPAAIRLLVAAKPSSRIILVTDAMEAAGMPDGQYELGGLPVVMKNDVVRLRDGNALAGSSLSMIRAFRFMMDNIGLSITDVSRMASGNPARQIGFFEHTGSIAESKQADLVLLDEHFHVQSTWVQGRKVFSN